MRIWKRVLFLQFILTGFATQAAVADAPAAFEYRPQKLSIADRKTIAELYVTTCAGCHGVTGEGNGNGLSLYGSKDPLASAAVMHFGRTQPPPLQITMPAYGAQSLLTPVQIGQLAAYISSFRPPWP